MIDAAGLPQLRVLPDAEAVADVAASEIARVLGQAVDDRGRADWATTGGSAAPPIYRRLAASPLRDTVVWNGVHVWWGDDRFVPFDHPQSNVLPLEQILLPSGADGTQQGGGFGDTWPDPPHGAWIPPRNLHPIPIPMAIAHGGGPAWAAARYEEELLADGPARDTEGVPVLDLVVVGVGPDGHILSVFPGSAVWDATGLCAAVPAPTHIEPHLDRVTLHPRLVAAARTVIVVSTGAAKAPALGRAWTGDDVRELPVRAARRAGAIWILDVAAAAELPRG